MPEQMSLEEYDKEFRRPQQHAKLGMDFQADIDAANSIYFNRGQANIRRNKEDWVFSGEPKRNVPLVRSRWARTDDGRRMRRAKSDVDYRGGGRGFSLAFDAKETGGASLPLANIESSQIDTLCRDERCGIIAGFLVRFTSDNSVYWIAASLVRDVFDRAMYQPKGRAKHPKSLSRAWLEEHGRRVVAEARSNIRVDYLPTLLAEITGEGGGAPEVFTK